MGETSGHVSDGTLGDRTAAHHAERRIPGPWIVGLTLLGLAAGLLVVWTFGTGGRPVDAHAYFALDLADPYLGDGISSTDGFHYSPAFAQAIAPLAGLGWPAFLVVWRLAELGALVLLAGPLTPLLLFASPVASEINAGNVHLLLALVIVLGFRRPALWSFVLLTKVTPGVCLLWFAARREWRSLGEALVATIVVVAVSGVLAPGLWPSRISTLVRDAGQDPGWTPVAGPLVFRLGVAVAIVVWGALTDRPWSVPVAATLGMPAVWWPALAMLVGVIPFLIWTPATALLPGSIRRMLPPRTGGPATDRLSAPGAARYPQAG